MTGHVDGVARGRRRVDDDARSVRMEFACPRRSRATSHARVGVRRRREPHGQRRRRRDRFDVNLVPHTLEVTILGDYRPGTRVNLEVDIIARYVERLLQPAQRSALIARRTMAGRPAAVVPPC